MNIMTRNMRTQAATLFFTGTLLTGCISTRDDSQKSNDNVQNAMNDAADATLEFGQDIGESVAQFRHDSDVKITEYDRSLNEYRVKIKNEGAENKNAYDRKLTELSQESKKMKMRLHEYKVSGKDEWNAFKTEFNSDMDKMGKSITNFFTTENAH